MTVVQPEGRRLLRVEARDLAEATALAARRARVPALVGVVDDVSVRALLSLPPKSDPDVMVRRVAKEVHAVAQATSGPLRGMPVVVAAGSTLDEGPEALPAAGRSLREAAHVARAALRTRQPATTERGFHRLADVRLRGLLHLLQDDERLTAFVERELGPLLSRRTPHGDRLLEVLRGFCEHGGNKSAAAAAAHTSRTAYYQQLARIESVLGVRLDEPESVLSLHVALLALEACRSSG